MPHESQVVGWPGRTLFDADGSKVGKIEDVFADERTGRPAWATVSSGLFGRRHHFVPIENAREVEDGVAVPVASQLVKGAPNVDADGDLSRDDERALYRHYGMDDSALDGPDAGAAAADADHGGRPDATEGDGDDREPHPYAHHDERTRRDADTDSDGTDDRLGARDDADGPDDRLGSHDDADGPDDRLGTGHDAGADRDSGVPAAVQADATTEAAARAERERLAAEEAEHDRLAQRRPAPPAEHEAPVLDRELAQEDLSVAPARDERDVRDTVPDEQDLLPQRDATGDADPAPGDHLTGATDVATPVPDARFVGRPHVDDDYTPRHDHAIDPTGGADPAPAGRPAPDPGADRDPAGSGGSTAVGTPGPGTRLRRLVRSITPSKDDSHG